jgi:hypothetical protein
VNPDGTPYVPNHSSHYLMRVMAGGDFDGGSANLAAPGSNARELPGKGVVATRAPKVPLAIGRL